MKTLITFPVEERFRSIGNEILGDENIIWHPKTGMAEIFLIRNNEFPHNQNPKFIQVLTAGTDHIDMSRMPRNSLISSNAGAFSIPVAEHVFALLLDRAKKIGEFTQKTRKGVWQPEETAMLFGKTLGIIGYGGIGSRVASIGKALGLNIMAVGRSYGDRNVDTFVHLEDLGKLLKESDFIAISIPLTKKTYGLIGKEQLDLVKDNCIIINVARAEIVRKEDLIRFVDSNRNSSYLTDVWWGEPELKDSDRENVVITPHISGGFSPEIKELAFRSAFENIRRFIKGEKVRNIVKLEESLFMDRKKDTLFATSEDQQKSFE